MMTRDDVIRSTAKHIRRVGELLALIAGQLAHRAVTHDASKWEPEEWPLFEAATPKLADLEYGSEGYKQSLRDIKPAVDHHQASNSHHPEFFYNGVNGMSLLDLTEMMCDWKAAGERHATGSIAQSLAHNAGRFSIEDQLIDVLLNTAIDMGWMTPIEAVACKNEIVDRNPGQMYARRRCCKFDHDGDGNCHLHQPVKQK